MNNNENDNFSIGFLIYISGFILIIIFSIIGIMGIALISERQEGGGTLLIICIVGIFLGAIPIMGFGQLVDDIHILREEFVSNNNYKKNNNNNISGNITDNKISREQVRQYFKQ